MESRKRSPWKKLNLKSLDVNNFDAKLILNKPGDDASEAVADPEGHVLADFLRQIKDQNAKVVRPMVTRRRQKKAA